MTVQLPEDDHPPKAATPIGWRPVDYLLTTARADPEKFFVYCLSLYLNSLWIQPLLAALR